MRINTSLLHPSIASMATRIGQRVNALIAGLALLALVLAATTACSSSSSSAPSVSCPKSDVRADGFAAWDITSSGSSSNSVQQAHRDLVESVVRRAAVCGGHVRIDAFAGSITDTAVLYDGDVKALGGTQIARTRQAHKVVDPVMATVDKQVALARQHLHTDVTDVLGMFTLAAQYMDQLDPSHSGGHQLTFAIATDGIQTTGVDLNTADLTNSTATDLANTVTVPALPKATSVVIAGIGKTAGTPAPTSYTTALTTFWARTCARANPQGRCQAVVDNTTEEN